MTFLQAFFLGAVQGITEFLPVSSSAHLVILEQLLEISSPEKVFDVFLNMGTLLVIVIFFRRQICDLLQGVIDFLWGKNTENRFFFLTILLSSLPTIIIGGVLETVFNTDAISKTVLFGSMILFSIVLYICDRSPTQKRNISRTDSMLVGLAQSLAFIPGVSRLGICLSMMRYLKYSREESFHHAMILSLPPILGACCLKLIKILGRGASIEDWQMVAVGSFSAFLFGLPTLFLITKFLQKHSLLLIIFYRFALGLTLLARHLELFN
ncbi:MAG: undecaprenyl-diphosphate phosphatase [Holosporaceae bacterium]|jgi:undecaprenyl-diphosphatase|nr:undecaprenyl-diphosphate phosphatase [Holosporaceae bacterium]